MVLWFTDLSWSGSFLSHKFQGVTNFIFLHPNFEIDLKVNVFLIDSYWPQLLLGTVIEGLFYY